MRRILTFWATVSLLGMTWADALEDGFRNPPPEARPHTWYHMMNGNVTKAGITRDFEALAAVGIGGVQMFDAGCNIPPGGLDFNSSEWFEMFHHAAAEARRLGLEICIPNCSGWSSSGGPWNPASNAMKRVVFSETHVVGPKTFVGKLPRTEIDNGFYDDIAVLAFPRPACEQIEAKLPVGTLTTDLKPEGTGDAAKRLADGSGKAVFALRRGENKPNVFTLAYDQPVTAVALTFQMAGGDTWSGRYWLALEAAHEGEVFQPVFRRSFVHAQSGGADMAIRHAAFGKTLTFRSLRVTITCPEGGSHPEPYLLGELAPVNYRRVADVAAKTFQVRRGVTSDSIAADHGQVVPKAAIRDLTAKMAADGTLAWQVPAGAWSILRVGYICNGRCNHPASDRGRGLEVDKLSASAMDYHFEQYVGRLCRTLGPLAGNVKSGFNNILVDSYEVGSQNWTQGLEREFMRRQGYDLKTYLPAFAGYVVESVAETDRALEDFRRTVADLFAENYAGALAAKCRQYGLQCSIEPYGNCPADNLQYGEYVDIPMGEFWSDASNPYLASAGNSKFVSHIAHVWGRKFCATESFTANPRGGAGRWRTVPFSIKAQGDRAYAQGINRIIYHRFTHQPWADDRYLPGMTMGRWGMHLDRTQTWWPYAQPWFAYQARCQFLLQQGTFAADVLFFCGEQAPNQGGNTDGGAESSRFFRLPEGYDYDVCPTDAMYALKVVNGRVVVPGGVSYRLLAIPPLEAMTPKMVRQIAKLQADGAAIVWARAPFRAPGLAYGAAGDDEVRRLADEVFAAGVFKGTPALALKKFAVSPDVTAVAKTLPRGMANNWAWLHRRSSVADWYFVSMPNRVRAEVEFSFRQSGRVPELWNAESGAMMDAPVWREEAGRTFVTVPLEVCGSMFVVFRKPAKGTHLVSCAVQVAPPKMAFKSSSDLRFLSALYGVEGRRKDLTAKLNALAAQQGCVDEIVNNDLAGGDPAPNVVKNMQVTYVYKGETNALELGEHKRLAVPADKVPVVLPELEWRDGRPWAWQTLTGALKMSDGTERKLGADVPKPLVVDGAWDVAFPHAFLPNALPSAQGTPERVAFDALVSWPEREEKGVKYFSGTAVYRKKLVVNVPKGARLILDLGVVREVAEVTVNGRTFTPLWKPPFRVDITEALDLNGAATTIDLAVKVANLWANRLIGDDVEHADDCEWSGKVIHGVKEIGIKEIPEWVKKGLPSPTGRCTFTTWKHWDKHDPLQPSGLLGPVCLRFVVPAEFR